MGSSRSFRFTQIAVLTAALVLLTIFAVAVRTVQSFRAATDQVLRTQEIRVHFAEASSHLKDLYASTRSYLTTGDEIHLEAQRQSVAGYDRAMAPVLELVAWPAERRRKFQQFDDLVAQLRAEYDALIDLRRRQGPAAVTARVNEGTARRLVDAIRTAAVDLQSAETRRLEAPLEAVQQESRLTLAILAGGLALALGFVLAVVVMLRKEFRAREEARAYLQSVVDTVREPLVILTDDLHVNSANRVFHDTFQLKPADVAGRPFREIDDGAWNLPALLAALERVIPEQQEIKGWEVVRAAARSGPQVMLLNARKLQRPENDRAMLLLAIEDITERKAAETRLRELNESLRSRTTELETANRELEAFSYSVSHDLRAPLRHIGYFAGALDKHLSGQLDAKAQRYLATVANSARSMGQLIDDLLSFARIARTELRRTRVRLDEIVAETRRILQPETNGRIIAWNVSPLPEVEADPALLRQVFMNLVANALKYTRNRAEACIEIASPTPRPGEIVVLVRDNGAGFDMKYAEKLFGVFQRLHATHEFEGTGVGLANVRRIVERHGGRVWAEAAVERGATFYFSLPAAGPSNGTSLPA